MAHLRDPFTTTEENPTLLRKGCNHASGSMENKLGFTNNPTVSNEGRGDSHGRNRVEGRDISSEMAPELPENISKPENSNLEVNLTNDMIDK